MPRKSQAALEFLTTYAWAFLVIIIMVGALAYFGVLSPSKLLPDRCNFGSEVGCNKDFLVVDNLDADAANPTPGLDTDNALTMRLENNAGTAISVTAATATTDVAATTIGACEAYLHDAAGTETQPSAGTPTAWASDATRTFVVECGTGSGLTPKEKVKFNIELIYYPTAAGPTYAKTVFGE